MPRRFAVTIAAAVLMLLSACTPAGGPSTPVTRTGETSSRPSPVSTPTPALTGQLELGVVDTRDSPLATIRFLAQNHWDGYVNGTYYGVFAGIDRGADGSGKPSAAVAIFRYPGAHEVGMVHSGTGTAPLKIISADDDVLTLSDGGQQPIQFTVSTHRFSPVSHQTAHGCSPTSTTMPARAFHARVADVDHDGRADTEWALLTDLGMEFGVTTASGATVSGTVGFAGAATRSFVMGRLAHGMVAAITSEQRDSPLWAFVDCRFIATQGHGDLEARSPVATQFIFLSPYFGGAAGCSNGTLYQYEGRPAGTGREDIIETPITITGDGRSAVRGTTTTVVRGLDMDAHPDEADHYSEVTCGTAPVLHPHL